MRRRPLPAFVCTFALLATSACTPQADSARLDRIEKRLDALETRTVAAAAATVVKPSASGPAAPAAKLDLSTYSPGAIAVVHAAPTNTRTLSEVPADSVGGFVYTGGPLALHDLAGRGVRYTGLGGVELQGWFKAAQAGRYQFGEDMHGTLGPGAIIGTDCVLQVWLEDRVIGSQLGALPPDYGRGEQHTSLVVGADLQPGLYKLRLWTSCAADIPRAAHITADLLTKAPGELNLRGFRAEELLHQS